jgi:hypothetical protein
MLLYLKILTSWNEIQFCIKITVTIQVMLENKMTYAYNETFKGKDFVSFARRSRLINALVFESKIFRAMNVFR